MFLMPLLKEVSGIRKGFRALSEVNTVKNRTAQLVPFTLSEMNSHSLCERLAQIPQEIVREHAAIDHRFAAPEYRLFPVAVTYLVSGGPV